MKSATGAMLAGCALSLAVWLAGCSEHVTDPSERSDDGVVSDPMPNAVATAAIVAHGSASLNAVGSATSTDVAYVSLPPGTHPAGAVAYIRSARTGGDFVASMVAGGLDPVP